jgi:hypothetical protein
MKLSNLNTTIKSRLGRMKRDKLTFYPLLAGVALVIVGAVLIPIIKSSLPEMVPLFYSLPRAAERLASRDLLYLLPASSLIVTFINFLCIFLFTSSDRVISRMLSFSALLISILSLYTLLRIVFLIT